MALDAPTERADSVDVVYDAFITYSHTAHDLLAPRLQDGLQRFGKPWWKRRALRVFRDESSLSANPDLWSSITYALDRSAWFIALLSPEAAQSKWVNREIEYWLAHHGSNRIILVLTDGEFAWADGDIDRASSAAPPALFGAFSDEPRWVELPWASTDEQLDLNNARFRSAIADIASAIHGVPKEDLESKEVRQHRRTVRTAWAAILALVILVIGTSAAGIAAVVKWGEASDYAAEIAAGRTGVLDTVLGRGEWFRVSGDAATVPGAGSFVGLPDGYAALEYGQTQDGASYWTSPDGLSWSQRQLPASPGAMASLVEANDGYWIVTDNPVGLWYSEDGDAWSERSLPEGVGLDHFLEFGHAGGLYWLSAVELTLEIDDAEWDFCGVKDVDWYVSADGEIWRHVPGIPVSCFEMVVGGLGSSIVVRTSEIGPFGETSETYAISLVADEAVAVLIPEPWARGDASAQVIATGDTLIAFVGQTIDPERDGVWVSSDGRDWTHSELPSLFGVLGVEYTGGRFFAPFFNPDDTVAYWESKDGVSWERTIVQFSSHDARWGQFKAVGAGWVLFDPLSEWLWITDGERWERIETSTFRMSNPDVNDLRNVTLSVVGDTLFFTDGNPLRTENGLWVIKFPS